MSQKDNRNQVGKLYYGKAIGKELNIIGIKKGYIDKNIFEKNLKKTRICGIISIFILIFLFFITFYYRVLSEQSSFFTGNYDFLYFLLWFFFGALIFAIIGFTILPKREDIASEIIQKYYSKDLKKRGYNINYTPKVLKDVFGKDFNTSNFPEDEISEVFTSFPSFDKRGFFSILISVILIGIVFGFIAFLYVENPIENLGWIILPFVPFAIIIGIILLISWIFDKKNK